MTHRLRFLTSVLILASTTASADPNQNDRLARSLDPIAARYVHTGILHDRVVSLAGIETLDGSGTESVTNARWLQAYYEMREAHLVAPMWPDDRALRRRGIDEASFGRHAIGLLNLTYSRLRGDALADGSLEVDSERIVRIVRDPVEERHLFAASALRGVTYRGGNVSFVVPSTLVYTNEGLPNRISLDADDGLGWRDVNLDAPLRVEYGRVGSKRIQIEAVFDGGVVRRAGFTFDVAQIAAPAPDDTLAVTASIDHLGQFGAGVAYVYLAPGHASITNPVIVIEGFDLDNSMNWDELYALLNDENLLEDLRTQGFDAIVVNFADATSHIQRNGFVVVEAIQMIQAMVPSSTSIALVGASMGGLCGRYALSFMESNSLPHRVRTFISFDSPQNGADIPLGIQYWLDFFSGISAEAANLLATLDSPAAKQMLVYHHTDPPGTTGAPHPLRTTLVNDLAAVGNYPSLPRLVAIANGAGDQETQGFAPRDQIILYDYSSFLVDIKGNVYAITDGPNGLLFDGEIDYIIGADERQRVEVSGTLPYDGAPGGWRNSMQQMDEVSAPFGNIIALHNNHCFIPTISALDLSVTDPFYDIANEPIITALTPFAAVYYPTANQPHVDLTAENKLWIESELAFAVVGVGDDPTPTRRPVVLHQNEPNPFNPSTRIRFTLTAATDVHLTIHDVSGRRVRTLVAGRVDTGVREITWDGTNDHGERVASGVYLYRLRTPNQLHTRKMALIK